MDRRPKATHFYVFCMVSFVLYAFKYTGKLDFLDQIVYWGNVVAGCIAAGALHCTLR